MRVCGKRKHNSILSSINSYSRCCLRFQIDSICTSGGKLINYGCVTCYSASAFVAAGNFVGKSGNSGKFSLAPAGVFSRHGNGGLVTQLRGACVTSSPITRTEKTRLRPWAGLVPVQEGTTTPTKHTPPITNRIQMQESPLKKRKGSRI